MRTRRHVVMLVVTVCACSLTSMLWGAASGASVVGSSVTPATGGGGVPVVPGFTSFDPAVVGYRQSEFFLSGTASAYAMTAPANNDGKYSAVVTSSAPYKTRAVVMRPVNPRRFNGTVLVEWLNVSGGADNGPDWTQAHTEMIREGFVWVGVSAQKVGVDALRSDQPPRGDPVRYASLSHPGDDYSYDMFSQAGGSLRQRQGVDPLGGLKPRHVIATGESQSAFRMVTYVNAIAPIAHVFDGYLIHSRGGSGAALSASSARALPAVARIRTDLSVPVMTFETETDLVKLGFFPALQPDTAHLRTWEVAGTSHADQSTVGYGIESAKVWSSQAVPDFSIQCGPLNAGPQGAVLHKVWAALTAWVSTGVPPATAPPMQTVNGTIARDQHGNALGGVRTPAVDAPTATLTGLSPSTNFLCSLFGQTTPLSPATLASLYPTHADTPRT